MASKIQLVEEAVTLGGDREALEALNKAQLTEYIKTVGGASKYSSHTRDYVVAQGRSVTSRLGVLGPGTAAPPELFNGGADTVAELAANGVLVEV